MPQSWDMGLILLLPLRSKAFWEFFGRPKNPTASAGFEPANSGSSEHNWLSWQYFIYFIYFFSLKRRDRIWIPSCLLSECLWTSFHDNKEASAWSWRLMKFFFFIWCKSPHWAKASSFTRFLNHSQRHTTVSRTPMDEWSVPFRDLYLTTHNTRNRQISILPVGYDPTIWAGERPQTYALDRSANGTGHDLPVRWIFTR